MSYTLDYTISLGSAATGLTLNAQIYDTAGGNVGAAITTGFTEIGTGTYHLHCTTIPDDHRGGVKSTGLDNISVTDPGNVVNHTSIAKMLVALWRFCLKKTSVDANYLKMFADDDTTVTNTMEVSDDGTTQIKGAAS